MGALLGVSGSMIAQYETDKRNPKQETIQRIADALECDFYWLLWGERLSGQEKSAINTIRIFDFQDERDQRIVRIAAKRMEYELMSKGYTFSEMEQGIVQIAKTLNDAGQRKVKDYAQDLSKVDEYRCQNPAEAPPASPKDTDTPTPQDAAEEE